MIYDERNKLKQFDFKGVEVVVKRYKKPHLINQFAYKYIRPSKAKRAFLNAEKLLSMGIKSPPPVGFLELTNIFGLQDAYYACLLQPYRCTIRQVMDQQDFPKREHILRDFARFTIHLQANNIYFLDHSPGNTLLIEKDGGYTFSLVDINRMQFRPLKQEERYENFSKLTTDVEVLQLFAEELSLALNQPQEEVYSAILKFMQADQAKRQFKRKIKFWKKA